MKVIGVDVGGTTIKALPVDVPSAGDSARVLGEAERRPTPADAPAVLSTIADLVETLRHKRSGAAAQAIGVVVPGIVDEPAGVAVHAANLGWDHTPVRERLIALTGLPVAFGHDVRAGGLAEWRLGAARGTANAVVVMLGTGIGSAVISDGRLLTGGGYAGQLGHIVVEPDGPSCGCGGRGCLGVMASASAVVARYAERAGRAGEDGPQAEANVVTGARVVAERARAGDPAAAEVWADTVAYLSRALAVVATLFGPEVVVLGGGLALAGDQLIGPVAEELRARLTFQRVPRLVRAELGDRSGIIGAALLAATSASAASSI